MGDKTYIHQFKINGKAAFDGDVWQWHQDYGTWKADDDMPEARAMNLAVFVDEVNEFNGPLWFIPKSHKKGAIEAKHDLTTTQLSAVGDRQRHHRQAGRAQGGIVAPKGGPGSAILFHGSPGARQPAQHVAVGPPDHLRDLQRGLQRHPPLQAARPTSPIATSRRSMPGRTTAVATGVALPRRTAAGETLRPRETQLGGQR